VEDVIHLDTVEIKVGINRFTFRVMEGRNDKARWVELTIARESGGRYETIISNSLLLREGLLVLRQTIELLLLKV
jgi:hypothetical protein